jgi:hypothetical protein
LIFLDNFYKKLIENYQVLCNSAYERPEIYIYQKKIIHEKSEELFMSFSYKNGRFK